MPMYRATSVSGTTKLSSATSATGYTNEKSVWGAALSSMLIAMVRYYCIRTGTDNLFLDEGKIMKTCIYDLPGPHSLRDAAQEPPGGQVPDDQVHVLVHLEGRVQRRPAVDGRVLVPDDRDL
ncbi:hypothetical protein E4U48_002013 [Claviceps purpurea]|nr:hypothetical protein E4U48_002013 [Claviceps purpurea]